MNNEKLRIKEVAFNYLNLSIMEGYMMLLVILLLISVALNVGLVFGMIRKRADEDMMTIRLREGLRVE